MDSTTKKKLSSAYAMKSKITNSSAVANINVQFAYFRKEMTTDSTYKKYWQEICNTEKAKDVSDIFLEKIERAGKKNLTERRNYARTIYYKMKKF